jgi:omega-6 fatty acid desaturase (delta-12 desaturase)
LTAASARHPIDLDPRALLRQLAPYRQAETGRSLFELAITAIPFALLWLLTYLAVEAGYLAGLLLALPAGGLLLRLFLIQHDCGHGAFFRRNAANGWVGRVLGVLTLTPYEYWRRSHAIHHAHTGDLDARGVGDVDTLTVAEFRARSLVGRFLYRLYRSPIVLFGLGPAWLFLLRHRLPIGMMRQGWRPWASAMGTNAAIAAAATAIGWLIGFDLLLLVHLPIVLVAATLGVWFFYVQHQFERTLWDRDAQWTFHEAALYGSSHYALPAIPRWFSANVGIHHVHHLASRIPFYRLDAVVRDFPMLASIGRLGIAESFRAVRLVLWDEQQRRLVSFDEAR